LCSTYPAPVLTLFFSSASMTLAKVRLHVILLHVPADGVDAGDVLHAPQLRADDPVLHLAQVGDALEVGAEPPALRRQVRAVALPARPSVLDRRALAIRRLVLHGPHEDLAQPGRNRPHAGFDAGREVLPGLAQPLGDLLAGEVDVDIVLEDRRHLREAVARQRSRGLQAGNARQRALDREGHLLLDLDRREPGCDGVDLDLVVGDVRHRVDRQALQRVRAEGRRHRGEQDDQPAIPDREVEEGFQHERRFRGISGRARRCSCRARPSG
jgi:hypothetical protein